MSAPLTTKTNVDEITAELTEYAQACLDHAQKLHLNGGIEVGLIENRSVSVGCRSQKIENTEFSGDFMAMVRVLHNQKVARATISERSIPSLLRAIDRAYDYSRYTSDDPLNGMPDSELMCTPLELLDLGMHFSHTIDIAGLEDMVLRCEQAGFDADTRIANSEGAGVSSEVGVNVYTNSHGHILNQAHSAYSLSVNLLARERDSSESDGYFSLERRFDDLANPDTIAREAARRAVAKLHARQPRTGHYPVIYTAEVAGEFLGHLLEANFGGSIKSGDSFLIGKVGRSVAAPLLQMRENPFLTGARASRCYDGEGVRTWEKYFVEDGRLVSHILDSYHARYFKTKATGNAGGVSNIEVESSQLDEVDLIKEAGTGLLVTDLIGFGVNTTTGDYSRGANGFWFENGEIQYPVNKCTVAGSLPEIYQNIRAIAANRWRHSRILTGSVWVDGMMVGGTGG